MTNPSVVQDIGTPLPGQEAATEQRLSEVLSSYQGREDELIPILQRVQQDFGYLPEGAMRRIAKFLKLPESTVFGVGTFYAQFKLHPSGKNIVRVCRGTACHVRGGARILRQVEKELGIKPGETTPDFDYSLETVACFGACALAPVVVLNDNVSGRMTTTKVTGMLGNRGD